MTASFSPTGEILGVAACSNSSANGELLLYRTPNLQKVAGPRADSVVTSLAFTPGGSLLFAGGYDGTVRVVETQHFSLIATLFRSSRGEWVVFTPDGLYDASTDGARLLGWRMKGQIVSASKLPEMRQPGLLSMLVAGKRPKPDRPLGPFFSNALSPNH
ncbi:MAG: WD40 repeat domain-containing protein [Candidatus Acidiferrum sp.]